MTFMDYWAFRSVVMIIAIIAGFIIHGYKNED